MIFVKEQLTSFRTHKMHFSNDEGQKSKEENSFIFQKIAINRASNSPYILVSRDT